MRNLSPSDTFIEEYEYANEQRRYPRQGLATCNESAEVTRGEMEPEAFNVDELQCAMEMINLQEKWLQPFEAGDPFNANSVRGFLSNKPDHRYGALAITHVNGESVPQIIYATPKLHYPFDKQGAFRFPHVRSIEIYEKFDGTNVLAYRYQDAAGTLCTTYKLRLSPFLRNGRFGNFLEMWREMIDRYPEIPNLADVNGCSISFELYGSRNEHLIAYKEPLSCAVLFGVDREGGPVHPCRVQSNGVPVAPHYGTLLAEHDPVARYNQIRETLERENRHVDDAKIAGREGTVCYVTTAKNETVLFKCKPESIEAIHWAGGISKNAVEATCWNLLETHDSLDFDSLARLLVEEYSQEEIDKFRIHIDECIDSVNVQLVFRARVIGEYKKTGMLFSKDKAAVMRQMSPQFKRTEMKKVYSVLSSHAMD